MSSVHHFRDLRRLNLLRSSCRGLCNSVSYIVCYLCENDYFALCIKYRCSVTLHSPYNVMSDVSVAD